VSVAGPRRRARGRLWTPSAPRAEILATLSELFADAELTCEEAIAGTAAVAAELLGDGIVIDLLSADCRWMYPLGAHHPDPSRQAVLDGISRIPFRTDHGFTACVMERREALLIPAVTAVEMHALEPEIAPVGEALGMRGFVIAPQAVRGRIIGFVWQVRTRAEPALEEDDRRFLQQVAIHVALGIESRRPGEALEL
jgi:GAF domain-containing protein